jgi:hypothetical protein
MNTENKISEELSQVFLEKWFDRPILHKRSALCRNKELQNVTASKDKALIGLQGINTTEISTLN